MEEEIDLELQALSSIYTSFNKLDERKFTVLFDKEGNDTTDQDNKENILIGMYN